jgi:c-di-GMP-related signal transduction protein
MSDIYIGRQPIYDRKLGVYAYELLFRAASDNSAKFTDGDQATSDVIVNTFLEIGLDNIVGDRLAFINLTRAFFVGEHTISLPRDRVVLELLEDIEADEEVVSSVKRLSEQGYSIALDDFIYHESLQPLVQLADIVKIDIMAMDRDEIREHVKALRQHPLRLVAEKVETQEEHDYCMELGFDYFQGYFLAQPKVIQGRRLPNNRLAILKLLSRLQDPEITTKQLEELIAQDVAFSYRILRYVNSAAYAPPRKIESIHQAGHVPGRQQAHRTGGNRHDTRQNGRTDGPGTGCRTAGFLFYRRPVLRTGRADGQQHGRNSHPASARRPHCPGLAAQGRRTAR